MKRKYSHFKREPKFGSLESLNRALGDAKGITSESSTLLALEEEVKNLQQKEGQKWLISYRKASSSEDRRGIDLYITVFDNSNSEVEVPIQIKSSDVGLFKHINERRERKGMFVPCMVVLQSDSSSEIIRKLKKLLRFYFQGKEKYQKRKKRLAKMKAKEK